MNKRLLQSFGAVFLVGGLLAMPSLVTAQVKPAVDDRDGSVHRLTIMNGSVRTVHYFGRDLSAEDRASLRELEMAQNDVAWARYERSRPAEAASAAVPPMAVRYIYYPPHSFYYDDWAWSNFAELNYFLANSAPGIPASLPYAGWSYSYYTPIAYTVPVAPLTAAAPQVLTLNGGVKPAAQTDEDSSDAKARLSLDEARQRERAALARVNRSQRLRDALKLSQRDVKPVARDEAGRTEVTVTMKRGGTHKGRLVREDKDWLVLEGNGQQIQVRKSEAASIARGQPAKKQ